MKTFSITYTLRTNYDEPGCTYSENVQAYTIQEAMKKLSTKVRRKWRGNRIFTIEGYKMA